MHHYTKDSVDILERFVKETTKSKIGKTITTIEDANALQGINYFSIFFSITSVIFLLTYFILLNFLNDVVEIFKPLILLIFMFFSFMSIVSGVITYKTKNINAALDEMVDVDFEIYNIMFSMYHNNGIVLTRKSFSVRHMLYVLKTYKLFYDAHTTFNKGISDGSL